MSSVTVVGIGPGDPELLTLRARELIRNADAVAGFQSVLAPVQQWVQGEAYPMRYADQEQVLESLAREADRGKRCVVCAWGDVSFSAGELIDRVRRAFDRVELVPGISSIQVACSRLALPIEECLFVTLHARGGFESALQEAVGAIQTGRRHLVLLPRPWDLMPTAVAGELIHRGVSPDTGVHVLEQLTLPGEVIARQPLGELAESSREFSDLSILVLPKSM